MTIYVILFSIWGVIANMKYKSYIWLNILTSPQTSGSRTPVKSVQEIFISKK